MASVGAIPTRECNKCGLTSEDLSLFVKNKGSKYGRRNHCQACYQSETKRHRKYRYWQTDHQVRKRYGIDAETYLSRMASRSACDICGETKELCYDHCHDTMAFRGVLCRTCNRSIGQLGDNADSLRRAYQYLLEAEAQPLP